VVVDGADTGGRGDDVVVAGRQWGDAPVGGRLDVVDRGQVQDVLTLVVGAPVVGVNPSDHVLRADPPALLPPPERLDFVPAHADERTLLEWLTMHQHGWSFTFDALTVPSPANRTQLYAAGSSVRLNRLERAPVEAPSPGISAGGSSGIGTC